MSSTNHTSHYNLSQYVGSDKPTYLVDYNSDMAAIDSGIYAAKNEADNNTTSIGTLSSLKTTEKSNLVGSINEVNTQVGTNTGNIGTLQTSVAANTGNIGTMANLDTTDKTSLVNAINEIVNKFNFSYKTLTISSSDPTVILDNVNLNSAYNSDGSIGKIYGTFNTSSSASSGYVTTTVTTSDTGLRPDSAITINGVLFQIYSRSGDPTFTGRYSYTRSFTLNTNGTISMELPVWYDDESQFSFMACLIFASDFGDTPIPPTP